MVFIDWFQDYLLITSTNLIHFCIMNRNFIRRTVWKHLILFSVWKAFQRNIFSMNSRYCKHHALNHLFMVTLHLVGITVFRWLFMVLFVQKLQKHIAQEFLDNYDNLVGCCNILLHKWRRKCIALVSGKHPCWLLLPPYEDISRICLSCGPNLEILIIFIQCSLCKDILCGKLSLW